MHYMQEGEYYECKPDLIRQLTWSNYSYLAHTYVFSLFSSKIIDDYNYVLLMCLTLFHVFYIIVLYSSYFWHLVMIRAALSCSFLHFIFIFLTICCQPTDPKSSQTVGTFVRDWLQYLCWYIAFSITYCNFLWKAK